MNARSITSSLVLVAATIPFSGLQDEASAAFVRYAVVATPVSNSGESLIRYEVFAVLNGPTDVVLNVFNFRALNGWQAHPDAASGFWHKDFNETAPSVLSPLFGTWNPQLVGNATTNQPFDSFLLIGGSPGAANTTTADPSWIGGGANPLGWNMPQIPLFNDLGWFNASPPNLQGQVGIAPNTASHVKVGQLILSAADSAFRTYSLRIAVGATFPGSPAFSDATFQLCPLAQTWYRDFDGDGFGTATGGSTTSCTQPVGYVSNNLDCNDNNAAINPNTMWYRDIDGDGFGSADSGTLAQCTQPSGYVLTNTDCDDSNAAIGAVQWWYRDLDGDGYGSASGGTLMQCAQPIGYVNNNTDCNDTNAAINPATVWWRDFDADGFGSMTGQTYTGCLQYLGYVLDHTDCNDNNAAINPNTVWYRDIDGDGYGFASDGSATQCTQPTGFVLNNSDNCPAISNPSQTDCNANGIGDVCDIQSGAYSDCNANGVLDICEGSSNYSASSPLLAPFGCSIQVNHTFTGLRPASGGTPTLTIEAQSDLSAPNEFIAVRIDGGPAQNYFVATGSDCPATPDVALRTFTLAEFNALISDGSLHINCDASGSVNSTVCQSGGVRLRLAYQSSESESDCNDNGVFDACEIAEGSEYDCNGNGVLDSCDIDSGLALDCNGNGKPDSCDISSGTSTDLDGNGVPDECAGQFVVGGSGFATMQAAIDVAPTGATILVGAGTFNMTTTLHDKAVTLRSIAGASNTTLSGVGLSSSMLTIRGALTNGTIIEGFTFRDGVAGSAIGDIHVGGAIALEQCTAIIRNCRFLANSADVGGAIHALNFSGSIEACVFESNTATLDGGALQLETSSQWRLLGNTFVQNSSGSLGGALSLVLITEAADGAIEACVFRDNFTDGLGSAMAYAADLGADLPMMSCTIEGNTSDASAAIVRVVDNSTRGLALQNTRFCFNAPDNVSGPITDLGGNVLSQDCDGDGACDADQIDSGALDQNENGHLDICEVARGDLNLDGIVNGADISVLLSAWGATNPLLGDLTGDGLVNAADLAIMLGSWGSTP